MAEDTGKAAPTPRRRSSLQQLRERINLEMLLTEMESLLVAGGAGVDAWRQWPPVLAQVRVSSADTKWQTASSSPERQVKTLARYCVKYSLRPVELCFEAQSGALSDTRPRRLFNGYYGRIERGELDVVAVITYNIDRFTRDRFVGEQWLRMLKASGVDLHEADEMEPPRPLAECEEDFASKLFGAWREHKRAAKRIADARRDRERSGKLINHVDHYGHRPVFETRDGVKVVVGATVVEKEAAVLREATERLHAGASVNSVVWDFNARGLRGRYGGMWAVNTLRQQLVSPRMIGMERSSDGLVCRDIEPILTEEQWRRNCELLTTERRPSPRVSDSLSALCTCATCGNRTRRNVARAGIYYRCAPTGLQALPPEARPGPPDARHAARRVEVVERFLLEVALRAVADHAGDGGDVPGERVEARRQALQTQLAELDDQRRSVARDQRRGVITEAVAEKKLRRIVSHADQMRAELAELQRRDAAAVGASFDPELMRSQAKDDDAGARDLIRHVIERCVLHPRERGYSTPYNGIDVIFAEPYALPESELNAVRARLNADHQRQLRLAKPWPGRSTREDGEAAFELHQRGYNASDITKAFNNSRRPTQTGTPVWSTQDIDHALQRVCDERGIPYEPRRRVRTRYSHEARTLVYELCSDPAQSFAGAAHAMNQMHIAHPLAGSWQQGEVERCYAIECSLRGEQPAARDGV